jgi:hypothetical protein
MLLSTVGRVAVPSAKLRTCFLATQHSQPSGIRWVDDKAVNPTYKALR